MAAENSSVIRILKLYELLCQESDEQHPMLASAICDRLAGQGISCDRRTLTRNVRTLNDFGYEVMDRLVGHEKGYYVMDRSFSVPELKVMIDAVQAASFVTERKTSELINKIAALGGSNQAAILKGNMVCFNTRKHTNESIYYNVSFLEEAIERQRKVIFLYYDINEKGERVYRRDGHHYVVEPIALVFNEDNYYLMCYSSRYGGTTNYRVDRMARVEILEDEAITDVAVSLREGIAGYTEETFKMYSGEGVEVTLSFDDKLIGAVYDKFGEGIATVRLDEHTCVANVRVQISPTFWGWLFQFGDKMRLLSPESAKDDFKKQVELLYNSL